MKWTTDMAHVLGIDTFHKSVSFLAVETTRLIRTAPDDDGLERLHVELKTFQQRCSQSDIPGDLSNRYGTLLANFEKSSSENASATIIIDGLITAITDFSFTYARKQKRSRVIQELKTDPEALAMRTKLHH